MCVYKHICVYCCMCTSEKYFERVQKFSLTSPIFKNMQKDYLLLEKVNLLKVFYFSCLITVDIYLNFSYLEPIKNYAIFREDFNGLQVHKIGIITFPIRKLTSFSCTEQTFVEFMCMYKHVCTVVCIFIYLHTHTHTHTHCFLGTWQYCPAYAILFG